MGRNPRTDKEISSCISRINSYPIFFINIKELIIPYEYFIGMTEFRTRRKDKQVFPVGEGREIRREDDYGKKYHPEESPPEEKVLEEKAQKKHKLEKPSFSTRSNMHRDIKNMMRKEGSDEYGSKDYLNYRKKLGRDADRTYSRENRKAKKRRKKKMKKEEKQREKQKTKK